MSGAAGAGSKRSAKGGWCGWRPIAMAGSIPAFASLDIARAEIAGVRQQSFGLAQGLGQSGVCLTSASRYDAIGEIQAIALEQARALKARRYEAGILAHTAELAMVEGRREEALSLVRQDWRPLTRRAPDTWGRFFSASWPCWNQTARLRRPRYAPANPCW